MAQLRHALVAEDTFLEVLAVFKRIIISVIAITVLISLSGCYYYDAGMDNMLTPPKLTEGQNEIYQALQAQVGTGISLKYPRSGEHRSAFVIENIDGEAGKEALVFYQNNINLVSTSSLTVSILDQKDGNWVPAYDIAAAGSDIDQVAFSTFGTQDDKFIIIGYMLTGDKDKVMHIYRYRDGVVQDLFSFSYSLLQVVDIDDNGSPEVIALTPAATGKDGQITNAKANVIRPQGDSFEVTESVDLDSDITSYINVRTGLIDDQKTALYLDGLKGKEQISTQILFYTEGKLQNNIFLDRLASEQVTRQNGNLSVDIDGDRIIEIPMPELMPGYDANRDKEQLYFTRWVVYSGGEFVEKYFSYLNIGLSYSLTIPESMRESKITAKWERSEEKNNNEIVFYEYNGSLEESTEELFRICVINQNDIDDSMADYQRIATSGQLSYFVKTSELASELYDLNNNTLKVNFTLISGDN